jgi:hypothetical protein
LVAMAMSWKSVLSSVGESPACVARRIQCAMSRSHHCEWGQPKRSGHCLPLHRRMTRSRAIRRLGEMSLLPEPSTSRMRLTSISGPPTHLTAGKSFCINK